MTEPCAEPGTEPSDAPQGIAIIGMGLRLPGASTAEEFWRNLAGGVEAIRGSPTTSCAQPACPPSCSRARTT